MKLPTFGTEQTGYTKHSEKSPDRVDLPVADWYDIHDTALELHRSPTLPAALERLARFVEYTRLGSKIRAVLFDENGDTSLLIPSREILDVESSEKAGYQATFDVPLAEAGLLRLSVVLPIDKSIRDQMKLELLLEHLSIAGQHLPFR